MSRIDSFRELYRGHRVLVIAFLLTSAVALFFAFRLISHVVYWRQHHHEPVQPWMTVGYVGKAWGLDPREIDRRAGLPPPADHPFTLNEVAQQRGVPPSQIVDLVNKTVQEIIEEKRRADGK